MELRARIQTGTCRLALVAGLAALMGPAAADAAPKASSSAAAKTPVILKVRPHNTSVGKTLRIRGRNFLPGKGRNTVVLRRDGYRAVFVKADLSTRKWLKVKLPKKLEEFLVLRNGVGQPTRFRVRVLAAKLSKRATGNTLSPWIGPEVVEIPKPPVAPESGDCDGDGVLNAADAHDDDDLLDDATEVALKLDPCKADTDGDGVGDGFEYRSARDLNDDETETPNTFLPYPGKRPYPNPLDGEDAGVDYDGDSLSLKQEFALWNYSVAHGEPRSLDALSYSDGEQYSRSRREDGRRVPTLRADGYDKYQCFIDWADPAKEDACVAGEQEHGYLQVWLQEPGDTWFAQRKPYDIRDLDRDGDVDESRYYYDRDGDTVLSDDERDEDADGLTNFDETRGCMNPALWKDLYDKETVFPGKSVTVDVADEDSDGDGVRDGADDQDNDDVPNVMECSRSRAGGDWPEDALAKTQDPNNPLPPPGPPADGRPAEAFVHPYNPCLPLPGVHGGKAGSVPFSRTCPSYVPPKGAWAPFNPDDQYFFIRN